MVTSESKPNDSVPRWYRDQPAEDILEDYQTDLFKIAVQDKRADIPSRQDLFHGWQREEYIRGYRSATAGE